MFAFSYIVPLIFWFNLFCGKNVSTAEWIGDEEVSLLREDIYEKGGESGGRSSRFFPFFLGPPVYRLPITQCKGENGLSGTCYPRDQCSSIGGITSGWCSKGYARCCIIKRTCGETTKLNCTYFMSPEYPDNCKVAGVCKLTVFPCGDDICQLRLDFIDFVLAQPDANGNCIDDFLIITGAASSVPRICGVNTGQHVYVDFAGNSPITISVDLNSALKMLRKWNIKITQVKCCDRAPVGCLMEYTATSGKVMSFNYDPAVSTAMSPDIPGPGTRELANLNYGVCVEMAAGYCSIEWSQNPSDKYSFTVSGDTDANDPTLGEYDCSIKWSQNPSDKYSFTVPGDTDANDPTLGTPIQSVTGANCTHDYVIIPNPMQGAMTLPYDRFCGNALPNVTSSSKPFVLTVVTDGSELNAPPPAIDDPPDIANRGFCINYRQLPCPP